jgi:hypothetical protein
MLVCEVFGAWIQLNIGWDGVIVAKCAAFTMLALTFRESALDFAGISEQH